MTIIRWRGTWGIGDSMNALNAAHLYSYTHNKDVTLEMHWRHDRDYLTHPDDPETIVERTDWIHTRYHEDERVKLVHKFHSELFEGGNMNNNVNKTRTYIDDVPHENLPNNWIFKKKYYGHDRKKLVVWTPEHNSQKPRNWKNFLTKDDWCGILKAPLGKGDITKVELTYRTPIRDAFQQIQEATYVVCYDGMWHYIARNFSKPMFIPSWESVTKHNTPHAVVRPLIEIKGWEYEPAVERGRKEVKEFFDDWDYNRKEMIDIAKEYLKRLSRYYDEN
jgi:hypothetical protein